MHAVELAFGELAARDWSSLRMSSTGVEPSAPKNSEVAQLRFTFNLEKERAKEQARSNDVLEYRAHYRQPWSEPSITHSIITRSQVVTIH